MDELRRRYEVITDAFEDRPFPVKKGTILTYAPDPSGFEEGRYIAPNSFEGFTVELVETSPNLFAKLFSFSEIQIGKEYICNSIMFDIFSLRVDSKKFGSCNIVVGTITEGNDTLSKFYQRYVGHDLHVIFNSHTFKEKQ